MKAIMFDTPQRLEMIHKMAAKHESMFVGKFVEQMFTSLDGENSLSDDDGGSGIFGGKFGSALIKPTLVEVISEKISGKFGMHEYIAKSMCQKEGISYEPKQSFTA